MKTILVLSAALGLCILGALRFEPDRTLDGFNLKKYTTQSRRLRVLTWNIGTPDLQGSLSGRELAQHLVGIIERHQPDVVALQEVRSSRLIDFLERRLTGYSGQIADGEDRDRHVALLVRDTAVTFQTMESQAGHWALAATLPSKAQDAPVVILNIHADAYSSRLRRLYTEQIVDWARARKSSATLVVGDFNFELDPKTRSDFFTDDRYNDSESYSYLIQFFEDLGRRAGTTAIFDRRIDYVFASPAEIAVIEARVVTGERIGEMDHNPLIVEVAFDEKRIPVLK